MLKCAFLCAFMICVAGSHALAEDGALYLGGFDGHWTGKLKLIPANVYDADHGTGEQDQFVSFSFSIDGDTVHVYSGEKETEVNPGQFQIAAHKTNAIILSITSASDAHDATGYGGWVETWNFSLTHKDKDTVFVSWTRMVNNYLAPPDYHDDKGRARFVAMAYGEMSRESTP